MTILLDGDLVNQKSIPVRPESNLWRGQGWFETMAIKDGVIFNVSDHIERLTNSLPDDARAETDWQRLQTQIAQLAQRTEGFARGKLVVWEEDGAYRYAGWTRPYEPPSPEDYRQGVALDVQLRSHPPRWPLAHEKRTSYASVMEERSQSPEWDVLYCGLEGDVWETGIANILWMKQGTVYCPRSDGHWLSGTVLEATLETAEAVGLGTERRSARWDELGSFCWISNSLFGFLPVNRIATEDYDPSPPDGWMELRERLLSDKVFPRWHEISLFN